MLEKLTLHNFQKHEKLTIDFAPGVTCIMGSTDSGKSAVIRALQWVLHNTWAGDWFMREGAKGVAVRCVINDKCISRSKGTGGNKYQLDDDVFVSFGTGVPDEVQAHHNVHPLSIHRQIDTGFWFGMPARQVSQQVNAIVDLGVIDKVLGQCSKIKKEAQAHASGLQKVVQDREDTMAALEWVPAMYSAWQHVQRVRGIAVQKEAKATTLAQHVTTVGDAHTARKEMRIVLAAAQRAQATQQAMRAAVTRQETLAAGLARIQQHQHATSAPTKRLLQAAQLSCRQTQAATTAHDRATRLRTLISDMESRCPTCGKPL